MVELGTHRRYLIDYSWDVAMERPYGFSIDGHQYYIYPITLGKRILYERLLQTIGIGSEDYETMLREHRQEACRIVAISTCRGYDECTDERLIEERQSVIEALDDAQLVTLLLMILPSRQDELADALGIKREQQQMERVRRAKDKDRNQIDFGGVSIFGSLIDAACERYGWLPREVMWEVGYDLLSLMLKDSIKSIYLTDKERKRIHISNDREKISADNRDNLARIQSMNWN